MRRIFLNLVLGLVVMAGATTAAHAQHHGGHGGGFGGHGGGFGGHMIQPRTHHAPRFQPSHANAARPSSRVPSHKVNAARPSSRVPSHKINAARPSSRVPSHNVNAARPSGRTQAVASARRPTETPSGKSANHALGLVNNKTNGRLSANSRDLTSADNTTLNNLKTTLTSPQAFAGINDALAGKPMPQADVNALKGLLASNTLSGPQAGAVASALQTDQQIKRQLALNNALNGLANGTLPGGLAGLNGLGGLAGLGGLGGLAGLAGLAGGNGLVGGSGGGGGSYGAAGGCDADCSPAISDGAGPDALAAIPADDSDTGPTAEEEEQGGVVIQEVEQGGASDRAGLRVGDVILSFGGVPTNSFDELREAVQQAGGAVKVVFINSENGQTEYLMVEPQDGRIGVTCE